jgi:hypothetical protein
MGIPLRPRIAAAPAWLAEQRPPGLDSRRRLVETCRAELVWARADWLESAAGQDGWQDACLPHEQAAAAVVEVWGELHPVEHRLSDCHKRLAIQRAAGWDLSGTLDDIRHESRAAERLRKAFLIAAAGYRSARAKLGCTESASGWRRQKARIASNLARRAS